VAGQNDPGNTSGHTKTAQDFLGGFLPRKSEVVTKRPLYQATGSVVP
jgi:hypothetical protein